MTQSKIVTAIDSFKGCLTSREANQAAAEGVGRVCPDAEILQVPVSDGGESGAAHVFGPQKGAAPEDVLTLDNRAKRFAEASANHFGYDCSNMEGAGAAGGLGYAFLQYMCAECKSGIQLLLETIHFNEMVKDAELVITGEGSSDHQTLMGKLPMGILEKSGDTPVCLIAGRISDREQLLQAGFAYVECINPDSNTLEEAMRKKVATRNISDTVARIMKNCAKNNSCQHQLPQ